MFDARHIANEFIILSKQHGPLLTHMQIQKLVYFAHARMLALHKRPLINESFRAWRYGPVARGLYDALKVNSSRRIRTSIRIPQQAKLPTRERDIIKWCFNEYGRLSGSALSNLTHAPGAPWARTENSDFIQDEIIEEYYLNEWKEETKASLEQIRSDPKIQAEIREGIEQLECGEYRTVSTFEELRDLVTLRAGST